MNDDQAKLILSAYRPNGEDASDPAFADALDQTQRDPALGTWFGESQAFDRAIADKLRAVAVPASLRSQILAGSKMSRRRGWWKRPAFWAIAAAVILFATILSMMLPSRTQPQQPQHASLSGWQTESLSVLSDLVHGKSQFTVENSDFKQLAAWARGQNVPAPAGLPTSLEGKQTIGCKTISWQGHTISLICFHADGNVTAHLFTTDRAGLPSPPPEKRPVFSQHDQWRVASWSDGNYVHMLAIDGDDAALKKLLAGAAIEPRPTLATLSSTDF